MLGLKLVTVSPCRQLLLPVFILLCISSANAQQEPDTVSLKEVEIIGISSTPSKIISKGIIDQAPLPDVGDLLRTIPGISGIKKGGSAIDPVIRGFRFSQLTVIADDGLRVEGGCPNRMDPVVSHIESDDIESIAIVKGPYALRFGPSFGGTVRLITFTPKPQDGFQVHVKSRTSLNSNPAGFSQYLRVYGGGRKLYFGLSGSYRDYSDYSDGEGQTVAAAFRKYNISGSLGFKPAPNQELILSVHRNYGRDVRFPALPMDEIRDNTTLLSADYYLKMGNSLFSGVDVKVYHSGVHHEMDNSFRPAYSSVVPPYNGLMQAIAEVDAYNRGGRIQLSMHPGKNELVTGFDLESAGKDGGRIMSMIMNMGGVETISVKRTNLWKKAWLVNSGFFGEFSRKQGKYTITASARLDLNMAASDDTLVLKKNSVSWFDKTSSTYLNLSANAGITRMLGEKSSVSLYAGRGMRSPDLSERFIKFLLVGYDNYDYLGNPLLKPEINYQSDLVAAVNLGDAGKLEAGAFASLIDRYISGVILPASVATPKTMGALGVKQFMNSGRAYLFGFEAGYTSAVFHGLSAGGSAAYTYGIHASATRNRIVNGEVTGIEQVKNDAIQEIPPFEAQLDLKYRFFRERMEASIQTRFVASQQHVSLSYYENETPGFVVMNASLACTISRVLQVSAGAVNIFDKTYYEHLNRRITGSAARLNEAGRNFYLNLIIQL